VLPIQPPKGSSCGNAPKAGTSSCSVALVRYAGHRHTTRSAINQCAREIHGHQNQKFVVAVNTSPEKRFTEKQYACLQEFDVGTRTHDRDHVTEYKLTLSHFVLFLKSSPAQYVVKLTVYASLSLSQHLLVHLAYRGQRQLVHKFNYFRHFIRGHVFP
jgi:hypothetical protein